VDKPGVHFRFHSYLPSQVKVVVAQVSLITQDVDEQAISVFKIIVNEGYVPDTKLHDIAMLQVYY
jgi:secreted trypsin-like serine protease